MVATEQLFESLIFSQYLYIFTVQEGFSAAFNIVSTLYQRRNTMKWYLKCVKDNYGNFKGRASREEYWMFVLFNFIFIIALSFIEVFLFGLYSSILSNIYYLAVLVPTIAVGVRRMHDTGKSGWFLLIPIYNLILAVTSGESGENQYGAVPE